MIKVLVPATTANMGPGFDSFGMALSIYNEICVEEIENGIGLLQEGKLSEVPLNQNLIYTSFISILNKYNFKYKGFRINISRCDIPISRGLGSSAACIVGGISAANAVMGNIMKTEDIIKEAVKIEGHPDNVVPAIVGGMTISVVQDEKVIYSKVNVPDVINIAVITPDFRLGTKNARKVLPESYSRQECVFNISRAAMLVNAMNNCELDKLRISVQDKIHQNYRKRFIKNIDEIFYEAEKLGSLAEFISGSGPTLIALIHRDNIEFYDKMKCFLETLEDKWHIQIARPYVKGVEVIEIK